MWKTIKRVNIIIISPDLDIMTSIEIKHACLYVSLLVGISKMAAKMAA